MEGLTTLPMFPLGTVLFPSMVLPLHVFEPRYRALTADVLAGGHEFGVVLIAQGHEVGGHDVRHDAGTVARVLEAEQFPDGRWALVAVGTRRVRVVTWLEDDPYPRAVVEDWPDPTPDEETVRRTPADLARVRRVLALAAEVADAAVAATVEFSDDPVLAGYQASAVLPVSTIEKQRLLTAASPAERAAGLRTTAEGVESFLRARLG